MLISVIVPVYNSASHLGKCIESVLNQTYKTFELILIDDGSTDESLNICRIYEKMDNRVCVIHQENKGVGTTRNNGIMVSKGAYIMFLDSDDYLDENMLDDAVKHVGKNEDMYVSGTLMEYYENNQIVKTVEYKGKEKKYSPKSLLEQFDIDYPLLCIGGPCSKLFKTSILLESKCLFNTEMTVSEDSLFCLEYLEKISTISFSDKCYYHYRREGNTSLWSRYTRNLYDYQCKSYGYMKFLIEKLGCTEETKRRFFRLYFSIMLGCIQNEYKSGTRNKQDKTSIVKKIASNEIVKEFIDSKNNLKGREQLIAILMKKKKYSLIVLVYDVWNIWKRLMIKKV